MQCSEFNTNTSTMNRIAILLVAPLSCILTVAAAPAAEPPPLRDKTLVVWAAPANLEQRGGSALTLDAGQGRFDGIVFGENTPKKWMPGSEGWRRTHTEQGAWPDETADGRTSVQIAIVYQDRQVTIYRNGQQYAQYTMANPPQEFGPQSAVLLGKRHLDQGEDGRFAGAIDDARIYDRALTAGQIGALKPNEASDIKPWAWWTFDDKEAKDRSGRFKVVKLSGGATVAGGKLVLDGKTGSMLATLKDLPPLVEAPGGPPNAAATHEWDAKSGHLRLSYHGETLFDGRVLAPAGVVPQLTEKVTGDGALEQVITLSGTAELRLDGVVSGSDEMLAAETRGAAQQQFPLVRTSNGASRNLRNHAVFDRHWDWLLAGPAGSTRLEATSATQFHLSCTGRVIELSFKPRYYQRHKNLPYFQPWTYRVRQDSISGWCSWWAYRTAFGQHELDTLLGVWKDKRLGDFGYRFIQIDDCYQGGEHAKHRLLGNSYAGGHPATWLEWRKELFPGGMASYVASVKQAGLDPGIWIGSFFGDLDVVEQHPDWFVRDIQGKPFAGPWIGYAMDATNPQAVDTLIRPTYRGVKQAGFSYVKIDQLRHYLYDNLHRNLDAAIQRGVRPDTVLRAYLRTARQELGRDTFMLACWGVLPEAIGIADACRIGGDGYGPVTMQQYNSWNGIVWRNDPDHCDVFPQFKPAEVGNVTKTQEVKPTNNDTVIRPALASIAGCLLMLSDKPEVYQDDRNLEGAKRASPVLFSVPGQLYDFDEAKTARLRAMERTDIRSGANPTPIDADQFGPVCPWWLNEFDRPFEHWSVLHRLNWAEQPAAAVSVRFADLGLDPAKDYLVYEFWSHKFLGSLRGQMDLPAIEPMGLHSYALREKLDRPQILSTSRHLSQGGVDLLQVRWADSALAGRSRVIAGDRYQLVLHVPDGFDLRAATFAGQPAETIREGEIVRVTFVPAATGEVEWRAGFTRPSK